MDNKNEKTFADLFSSSTTEDNNLAQSFNDILKNNDKEESIEKTKEVTFDSLFDQISESDSNEEIISIENKSEEIFSEQSEEIITPETETSEKVENNFNFNSIFQNEQDDDKEQTNDILKYSESTLIDTPNETIKETNQESTKTEESKEIQIDFNPFFEEKENTNSDIQLEENSKITTIENIETNDEIEKTEAIKNNNITESNNLFFQTDNNEEKVINEEENKEVFLNNDSTAHHQEITIDTDNNPFMNNNFSSKESIEEKKEQFSSTSSETTVEIAPNPFFESTISNNESVPTTSKFETRKENNSNIETKEENIVPQSTSPFFVEEQKSEENPFFQNQINLIENQVPNIPNTNIDISKSKHYNVKIVKKKEPLIKFILGVLSYALFIWLLLIGITLLIYVLDIKIRAAKGDYSAPTFNAYVVLTGSMLPDIKVYDVVVTKKVDAEKLKERDVITFASADSRFLGTIITHRILKKNPPSGTEGYTFQTKGDNNNVADSALVPEKNIYGKVILKIPKLGYLQEFLASDGGWIIVILIPCLTVISYDIVKLMKGLKRKKYKNIKVQK